jgi:hypothetical protein
MSAHDVAPFPPGAFLLGRRSFYGVLPHSGFARLPTDRLYSTRAKSPRSRGTPIPAGTLLESSATPSRHRTPQSLAILYVAGERKSPSLAELPAPGKSYSGQLTFSGTGHNSDSVRTVSQQTRAKSQSSDALLSAELPSRHFVLVPLANSHSFAFGAVGKFLVSGKPRLETNQLYLLDFYSKTFHGRNV